MSQIQTKWIANLAITTGKVAADAIDNTKLLLNNDSAVRFKDYAGAAYNAFYFNQASASDEYKISMFNGDLEIYRYSDKSLQFFNYQSGGQILLYGGYGNDFVDSGNIGIYSGEIMSATSSYNTGKAYVATGNTAGTGNSGDVEISTGTVVSGTRGIILLNGREVDVSSSKITNLADPVGAQDAATKAYVDLVNQGVKWKASVKAATTAAITLSGAQTIDTVSVVANDRVLVKDQATSADDGIYIVQSGAWTRAADAPQADLSSACVFVEDGSANLDKAFVQTNNSPATAQTWVQFGGISDVTNYDSSIAVYSGREIAVNLAASSGLEISSGLKAKVDGSTIVINGSGQLEVASSALLRFNKEFITLTSTDITNKYVTLAQTPIANSVEMHVTGSITQNEGSGSGYDYHLSTAQLSWDGNSLDGTLEAGDVLCVSYNY